MVSVRQPLTASRAIITAIFVLSFLTASILNACPGCKYSPDGWGFCHYYMAKGGVTCETKVADSWTGRTKCEIAGDCSWYGGEEDGLGDEVKNYYACNWSDTNIAQVLVF